jgi:hypothetical protein
MAMNDVKEKPMELHLTKSEWMTKQVDLNSSSMMKKKM